MSLASSLTLKDNAQANRTFVENKRMGFRVERIDTASTFNTPKMLIVDHSMTGPKGKESYRHLIQMTTVGADAAGTTPTTTIVNLTISCPKNDPSTATYAKDMLAEIVSMLTTAGACNATFDSLMLNQS